MPRRAQQVRELRNRMLRGMLVGGQRVGLDITPHHFYSNTPDIRALRGAQLWREPRTMTGVRGVELEGQADFVAGLFTPPIGDKITALDVYRTACRENGEIGYGPIEAEVLFAFMATKRPARVVQIGSGVSTSVLLQARREFGFESEITCIDPYPTDYLVACEQRGDIRLLAVPAQEVAPDEFARLGAGDLLFVDSTHTVKPGSEVNQIVLEILPALGAGVFVHFHDIYFPYDYAPDLLSDGLFFWNESVLLHSFLANNERVGIRASCSMLHHGRPDALRAVTPRYNPVPMQHGLKQAPLGDEHFPSAIYLQVAD